MAIETLANVLLYLGKDLTSPDVGLIQYLQPIADQLISDYLGFQVGGGTTLQQFTEWYPDRTMTRLRDELVDSAPYEMVGGRAVQYGLAGLNNQIIQLKQLPVRKIISCYEDPNAWNVPNPPQFSTPALVEGTDFLVDYEAPDSTGTKVSWTGEIWRLNGAWFMSPWSGRNVQVTYEAGWTQTELTTGPWPAFAPRVRIASCMTIGKLLREAQAQAGDSIGSTVTGTSGGAHTNESIGGHSIGYVSEAQLNNLGLELELPKAVMRMLERYQRHTPF